VLSEGAAFLVLEEAAHARARGVQPLAGLSGWGLSCDAAHPTTPISDGIRRAMAAALVDAGLQPGDAGQVSAHGTGSAANDAAEADAIARLLGQRLGEVTVTAIKGTVGHTEGAAGAFGALTAVLSLQRDTLPPLAGYAGRDPALPHLRLATGGAEEYHGRNVLVNASGFGGANASLLFEKPSAPAHLEGVPVLRQTRHPVITATLALTARDGTLIEDHEALLWPGGAYLPLDRTSGRVLRAAQRLLGTDRPGAPDPAAAVVLGTAYGSQARHESIWTALASGGPRAVDPNDFALSTFNAPGSAVAAACGLGGANLVFLGAASGAAAIEESARLVASGRARRVLAGAYDEATPYYRRVMAGYGEPGLTDAVALLLIEDEALARERGATALASIAGYGCRAPASGDWPDADAFSATMRDALRQAGSEFGDLAAVVLDPHRDTRESQMKALTALGSAGVTLIDLAPVYGNCLAAATPLAVRVAIDASAGGCWPVGAVLRGVPQLKPGQAVLINACGLLAGCASLVVVPHGA
jgi:3-oxoacyl-[acyl-carrier-protein] synthase II